MSQADQSLKVLVIAGVVVERDGKYLLVQENKPAFYGQWNLPGGRVDVGESLEEAAAREAKEESGFEVAIGDQLLLLHTGSDVPVIHAFAATITGGELTVHKSEVLDVGWFTWQEIQKLNLRTPEYTLGAIEALKKKS